MKRKIMLISALVLCIVLVLPLASCFGTTSSKSTSNQPTVSDRVTSLEKQSATQDKSIAALEKSVSSIPAMGDVNTAVSTANSAKSSVNDLKADVESITTELDKLKKRVAELEAGNEGSEPGNGSSNDSDMVDDNKDLKLYLTDISPSDDILSVRGGKSTSIRWEFEVANSDTSSHRYKIIITMYPAENIEGKYGVDDGSIDVSSDVSTLYVECSDEKDGGTTGIHDSINVTIYDGWVGKKDTVELTVWADVYITDGTANDGRIEFDYDYHLVQTD